MIAGGVGMGTAFASTPYATKPSVLSTAWIDVWWDGIFAYREAEAPLEREVTVYIGQGATAGTGTESDPYLRANAADLKTLMDSLYTTHAASTLRIRIARGTVWQNRAPKAINVTRANVTVDSYGAGHDPVFHGTETLAALGVASVGSPSGGKYTITLGSSEMSGKTFRGLIPDWGSDPTVLREWNLSDPGLTVRLGKATSTATGRTKTYRRRATAAAVVAQGEFHYDSGTRVLTLYPHTGVTPTTTNLRVDTYVNSSLTGMIESANHNSVRFEGLTVIGTGGNTGSDQCWGFFCAQASTNAVVIKNCTALYCGQHTAGLYNGSSGGILTVIGCHFGICRHYNSIPLIAFATSGGCEMWCDSTTVYGWIPDDNHSTVLERTIQPVYGHDGSGTNALGVWGIRGLQVWAGQHGWGARPYISPPNNTANPDDGTNFTVDSARWWCWDLVMDGGGYATRKNSGNTPRIASPQAGHVYGNCLFKDYVLDRTTDTTTIEYCEISTTDYDYRGWDINCIRRVHIGSIVGAHTIGYRRNNLGTGTPPNIQGVHEPFKFYCADYYTAPSTLSITSAWNRMAASQSANVFTSGGSSGNVGSAEALESLFNCLIVFDSDAPTSEDFLPAIPKAHAGETAGSGLRYTSPTGQTVRGGASRCMFYRTASADVTNGTGQQFGTSWHVSNTDCFVAASFTPFLEIPPAAGPEVVASHRSLGYTAGGQALEYDFYGRPRLGADASRSAAVGPIEMALSSEGAFGGGKGGMRDRMLLGL